MNLQPSIDYLTRNGRKAKVVSLGGEKSTFTDASGVARISVEEYDGTYHTYSTYLVYRDGSRGGCADSTQNYWYDIVSVFPGQQEQLDLFSF